MRERWSRYAKENHFLLNCLLKRGYANVKKPGSAVEGNEHANVAFVVWETSDLKQDVSSNILIKWRWSYDYLLHLDM